MNPLLATDWLNPHMQYSTRDIQSKLASDNIIHRPTAGRVTRTMTFKWFTSSPSKNHNQIAGTISLGSLASRN